MHDGGIAGFICQIDFFPEQREVEAIPVKVNTLNNAATKLLYACLCETLSWHLHTFLPGVLGAAEIFVPTLIHR